MYTRLKKQKLQQYDKQHFKGKQHTQPSNVFYVDIKPTQILHNRKISGMAEMSFGTIYTATETEVPWCPRFPTVCLLLFSI